MLNLRLDKVCIEHLDWQRCLELYDRPTTLFFLDPPYTECGKTIYQGSTNTDVQILRERVGKLRGKWILTLNDTPAIRAIFDGCAIKAVERAKGINTKAGERIYRELVITPGAK